jgi:hypothetical protein
MGYRLVANIHHAAGAVVVEVRKFSGHWSYDTALLAPHEAMARPILWVGCQTAYNAPRQIIGMNANSNIAKGLSRGFTRGKLSLAAESQLL